MLFRSYMNLNLLSMLQKYIFYYEPAPERILKLQNSNNSVIIIFIGAARAGRNRQGIPMCPWLRRGEPMFLSFSLCAVHRPLLFDGLYFVSVLKEISTLDTPDSCRRLPSGLSADVAGRGRNGAASQQADGRRCSGLFFGVLLREIGRAHV